MTHSDTPRPIVALPGTKNQFALYLCFSVVIDGESKLVTIEIGKALVQNNNKMRMLLSALKCAVDEIANGDYSGCFVVEP